MNLEIEFECELDSTQNFFNQQMQEKILSVIEGALDEEDVPYEVEISLTITNKEQIQQINFEQRNINKYTDVLSFPQIEPAPNGGINWDILETNFCTNHDTGAIILGDIVLCFEVAKEQAQDFGHSLEREVCFLVAHSMFHLLGYDHMTKEDEARMIEKQENVLTKLKISR
ncbi:MAG: rRNA maturation RNase YbeY [Epulopiscium sp. Nele67-Bin005]|nr:MAG: rRNA maturation RNase YbeY [Epulopiscium sp. Nele67-Bin005]